MSRLLWHVRLHDEALACSVQRLRRRLDEAGLRDGGDLRLDAAGPGAGDAVVVWADHPLPAAGARALLELGRPLVLGGPTLELADPTGALGAAAGVVPAARTPVHDVRLRAGRDGDPLADHVLDHTHVGPQAQAHLGPHTHVRDRVVCVPRPAQDVQELLAAQVGLTGHPMATWRPGTGVLGWLPGATAEAVEAPGATRLLVLALRHALGVAGPAPVRVGLLGYGAIGDEHRRAVEHVPGLVLSAVCDTSPARLDAVRAVAPAAALHASARALLADPGVDLVVVSTPPDTHATWARAALAAGKHVVVEKPFALTTDEVDGVLAQARARGLLASCYQNRRFDPDHLALRRLARSGRLGELFHLEAFVGGFGHPCNLWHSDAGVSGGAVHDWGAHVIDQLLDLVPDDVEHVSAAEHRRVWHDVTNADHVRVTIRFAGGAEATFVHSDIAAALKPRWYVLGTAGAVVGSWRAERVVSRSDIGTFVEDVLAPADAPPLLDLHAPDGSVTRLATPPGRPYAYHAELADSLRFGLPTTVTPEQSRRVVAVLEAATTSARSGGGPVAPR